MEFVKLGLEDGRKGEEEARKRGTSHGAIVVPDRRPRGPPLEATSIRRRRLILKSMLNLSFTALIFDFKDRVSCYVNSEDVNETGFEPPR
jgi:hypothetical protein